MAIRYKTIEYNWDIQQRRSEINVCRYLGRNSYLPKTGKRCSKISNKINNSNLLNYFIQKIRLTGSTQAKTQENPKF